MSFPTPFESDIAEQPAALRRLAAAGLPDLTAVITPAWERIVFTGMGSSDYAATPTWRRLIQQGLPAWTIDTSHLLDNLALVTPGTLLIVTSQSGASGEVVELLRARSDGRITPRLLVGIADDETSPLALQSDVFLPLNSGPEATVSTKSYLNTLSVHRVLTAAFTGEDPQVALADVADTATTIEALLGNVDVSDIAAAAATHPKRRLAYIGRGDEGATAQFAGLITKESSKVPAEGFVGGQFRHGPYELAGDGLTTVLFGLTENEPDESLLRLGTDLVTSGSTVVIVGDYQLDGAITIPVGGESALARMAGSTVVAELFAVGLAKANGVVPGKFLFGSKITTAV